MRLPRILTNSAIYTVIALLQKCIMFFLLPLYTAYLSPEDYGVMSVVTSITNFLSIFILYSLTSTATRFYFKNRDPHYAKELWGTLIIIVLINSLIIGSLAIVFGRQIIEPFSGEISFYPFVFIGIVNTIVSPLYLFFQSYLQTIQKGTTYGINSFLYFILQVSLTIFFLVVMHWGVLGVLIANLLTALVFFIYALIFFIGHVIWRINKEIAKSAVKYASPLLPHHLFAWSSDMIDKLMLNSLSTTTNTGLYSVAQQFGNIVNMVEVGVNRAYSPWFYDKINKKETKNIPTLTYGLITLYSSIAFIISLFSYEIIYLMVSQEFHQVWIFIPFLCFANVFQGVYFIFSNYLFLNKTKSVFYCTMASASIVVCLNFILIPYLGVSGTIISASIAIIVRSFVCYTLARKTPEFVQIKIHMVLGIIFAFFLASLIVFLLSDLPFVITIPLKLVIICVILGTLTYIKYESIKSLIQKNNI